MANDNVLLAWDNYVDRSDVVMSVSSEASGELSVRNLINPSPQVLWRTLADSTPHWVEMDFGSELPVNVIAFEQWRDGLTFQAGDTIQVTIFDSADALVYDSGAELWAGDAWAGYYFLPLNVPVNAKKVRIDIVTSGPYAQIGRIWIAEAWQPRLNFSFDWSKTLIDDSKTVRSPMSGIRFTRPGPKRRQVSISLSQLSAEEAEVIEDADITSGNSQQIMICTDPMNWPRNVLFGVVEQVNPITQPGFDLFSKAYQIVEDN